MKSQKIITLLLLFLLCFALTVVAQEKEKENKIQAYYINEDQVKPCMVFEYEEALKEYSAFMKENKYKYPLHLFSTDDFIYYYSTPMDFSGAYLDSINAAYSEVVSKDKEKWGKIWEKFEGTYHYNKSYVIAYNSALSYSPKETSYKGNEKHYVDFTFVSVKVGKSGEMKEILKKWVEIYKKYDLPLGFDTYIGNIGTEQPLFIWISRGKDRVDHWTKAALNSEKFKDNKESDELWKETLKLIRKMETKAGFYRPDLSYQPEK